MLRCETNTKTMQKTIETAARKHFKSRYIHVFFEHGQWCVIHAGKVFSVNDAQDRDRLFYFDFEEL